MRKKVSNLFPPCEKLIKIYSILLWFLIVPIIDKKITKKLKTKHQKKSKKVKKFPKTSLRNYLGIKNFRNDQNCVKTKILNINYAEVKLCFSLWKSIQFNSRNLHWFIQSKSVTDWESKTLHYFRTTRIQPPGGVSHFDAELVPQSADIKQANR